MSKDTFILIAIGYYIVSIIVIIVVLSFYNKRIDNKFKKEIDILEKEKNLIISASILSELSKVESLAKNPELKDKYVLWQKRFKSIKEQDVAEVADEINDIESLFIEKNYSDLKKVILSTEIKLNQLKTKADFLLEEIKEITTSEEKNRETITKLKAEFREIKANYKKEELAYHIIKEPIELQFENIEKLFVVFEDLMQDNSYTEVAKVVKAIDDIIKNLSAVVTEGKLIVSLGNVLIPKKIEEVMFHESKLEKEGFNLEYLNIDYNKEEVEKKITDVFDRLKVLNIEDSLFELKTIYDYFDSLLVDFDKERMAKTLFEDYIKNTILKISKLEKINNEMIRKVDELKYVYDLKDEDAKVVFILRDELLTARESYDNVISAHRNMDEAYSKLLKKMELIRVDISKSEDKLNISLKKFGSLKEDEQRARDELQEIKGILHKTKDNIKSFKIPHIPKNYYVELSEAIQAIDIMKEELGQRPIVIETLNMRVDNARDLVLKVYATVYETVKTAKMAETAIVYGNRYRVGNKEVDNGLTKAENAFNKGVYKTSLEHAIHAIDVIEPGIHKRLLEEYKE